MTEWPKVKFGDLYLIDSSNGVSKPSGIRGDGYKMINMGELFDNGRIYDIPMEFVPLSDKEKVKFPVRIGDLLFARQSLVLEGAGKCSVVMETSELTVFESHLIRVRLDNSKAYSIFYYYFFSSVLSPVKTIVSQCAQAGIRGTDLKNLEVLCPPLPVQRKIAGILSAYDDLIENNRRQIKLLEEAARRLYKEWFVDLRFPGHEQTEMVDGLPAGWHKGHVEEVVNYHDNERIPLSSMNRNTFKGKFRYYGAAGILDYVEKYIFDGTYLLLGEDGSVINTNGTPVLQYVTGKFWVNNHAHVLTGNGYFTTEYIYMMFMEMIVSDIVTGVAQPKISQARLSAKEIVVPAEEIVKHYTAVTTDIFLEIIKKEQQNQLIQEARDRLLPKLMSGEIEVDPSVSP